MICLRACLKTRPVRGLDLQNVRILTESFRPRALTRRPILVFKQALSLSMTHNSVWLGRLPAIIDD